MYSFFSIAIFGLASSYHTFYICIDTYEEMSSSSSKPSAIAHNYSDAIDRVMLRPFDDTRGKNNDGGWWISLEEAKKKYGIWWTETTEMSDEKNAVSSVPIPGIKYPIWMYKDKSMYLGSWREIRMGSGGGTRRHEHGDGIQCKRNGQCFVGQFENGSYHGVSTIYLRYIFFSLFL